MIANFSVNPKSTKHHTYGKSWRNIKRKPSQPVASLLKGLSFFLSTKDKKVTHYRLW